MAKKKLKPIYKLPGTDYFIKVYQRKTGYYAANLVKSPRDKKRQ